MQDDLSTLPDYALIRIGNVLRVLPVSKATFYAGIKKGIFPPPAKLGGKISAWYMGEIRECSRKFRK